MYSAYLATLVDSPQDCTTEDLCVDCQKPVWYCDTDERYYHHDQTHECFLTHGKEERKNV